VNGPPSADEAIAAVRARLRDGGIEQPGLEARLLVGFALRLPPEALLCRPERPLDDDEGRSLDQLLARRLAHEPLAYILEEREFWSLPLTVSADVLIPRPDSETLIEAALAWANGRIGLNVLDLGTGSGCLLLAVLSELPDAWGLGIDISPAALAVARRNAARVGMAERAAFACADWGYAVRGGFDLILCNPPYVSADEMAALSPDIARFEPHRALDGGADGLAACRRLMPDLARLKAAGGHIFLEIAADRSVASAALARQAGLHVVEINSDLAGRPRCLHLA
jgi:release factor glutamine methyltransferase